MQKYDNTTKRQIKVEDLTIEKYRLDNSHTGTIEILAGGAVDLQREQGEDGPGGAGRQGLLDEQEVRPRPRQRRLPHRHQQRQD